MRASLVDNAGEYSVGYTVEEILPELQAQYGITAKKASARLGSLQRSQTQTLHKLRNPVNKLLKVAYLSQE